MKVQKKMDTLGLFFKIKFILNIFNLFFQDHSFLQEEIKLVLQIILLLPHYKRLSCRNVAGINGILGDTVPKDNHQLYSQLLQHLARNP